MLTSTIFNPRWWFSTACTTLVTMCFIVMLKRVGANVPVLGTVVNEV